MQTAARLHTSQINTRAEGKRVDSFASFPGHVTLLLYHASVLRGAVGVSDPARCGDSQRLPRLAISPAGLAPITTQHPRNLHQTRGLQLKRGRRRHKVQSSSTLTHTHRRAWQDWTRGPREPFSPLCTVTEEYVWTTGVCLCQPALRPQMPGTQEEKLMMSQSD